MPTGRAGVCFKPPSGQPFAEMQAELEQLLATPDDSGTTAPPLGRPVEHPGPARAPANPSCATSGTSSATAGSWWRRPPSTISSPASTWCTRSLQDAGWSTQLLCSVFGFAPGPAQGADPSAATGAPEAPVSDGEAITRPLYLVYLAKQGTFYPFAPTGAEQRDNELELRLKGVLADDLPIEPDLSRWFPMWDLPIA